MRKILVAVLAAAVCAGAAFAEKTPKTSAEKNNWEVGFSPLAVAIPFSGEWGSSYGLSYSMYVYGERAVAKQGEIMGGVEAGRSFWHVILDAGSDKKIGIWQVTPYAKIKKSFETSGHTINAYLLAGAGIYVCQVSSYKVAAGTSYSGYAGSTNGYFGFNAGGGVSTEVAPRWEVGVDVRWHHVVKAGAVNNLIPSFKVAHRF
jgi:opacity protein-like surface antigen